MNTNAVEQIKDRLPLVEVLSSYLTLIPSGKQFKAKCPFHNERSASFSISPERNLYYCFGCGAKGDVFTFVQQFEGVDFNGALKILAERAGIELTSRDRRADDHGPLYEFLEKTTLRYQNELQKNSEALTYLKERGLTPETISQFRLGYAPIEWRFVANSCANDSEKKIAERVGLIKQPDKEGDTQKGHYDRFRGRIMFPLSDASGRVVGFSGRIFPETPDGPKYLNSPETELFQKSRVLYGFDRAKLHMRKLGFAIMVEGQMDLLLSHQAGFRNTVATSGTAVSEVSAEDERANLVAVSRLTPHLFLAFDGDAAGEKALARAALVALALGMNPKVVPVPVGIDPADILKDGPERWKKLLKESEHFVVHQARAVKKGGYSPHMLVRELKERVFPYLTRVASPIEQNLYMEAIARELGIDAGEVERELGQYRTTHGTPETVQKVPEEIVSSATTAKERFVAFVMRFPEPKMLELKEKLAALSFDGAHFEIKELPDALAASMLAVIERDYGGLTDSERIATGEELAASAEEEFFAIHRVRLAKELRDAEQKGDEEGMNTLLTKLTALNKRRHGT